MVQAAPGPGETFDHADTGRAGGAAWSSVNQPAREKTLEAFLVSTGVVALAEVGDKTQLLALVLAARYRRPLPIVLGILFATLANHALASAAGKWITTEVDPSVLRWILGLSFIAMAAWTLVPDKLDKKENGFARLGVFGATLVAFFLVEMGDKTQVATIALAAHYGSFAWVLAGTTLGMLIANVPVVYFGEHLIRRVPVRTVRLAAAAAFALMGVAALI
jgi:putative Ca2+/H+ antiporter (TMEM165/GDT1 family)